MAAPPYSRFDFTQWGTGLDSQGLPRDMNKVYDFYKQVAANPNTPYNKGILSGVQAYAKNNKGSTSDPFFITNALDWYWRDNQRKSQKAPQMFGPLDSILKPALTIGAGIINPALGVAVGGGLGAANGGGVLGGLLGAASGYAGGASMGSLAGALSKAGGLSTFLSSPTTFASNLGRGALTALQNHIPGYGGNVAGLLSNPTYTTPASVSSSIGKVASTASGLAPIVNGSASVATNTPPGVFQATTDLLANSLGPGNLLGNVAQNVGTNLLTGAVADAVAPDVTQSGGLLGNPSSPFGVKANWQNPYPELIKSKRKSIRNQLLPPVA